jgi:RND family efflux transporter MFP subunit
VRRLAAALLLLAGNAAAQPAAPLQAPAAALPELRAHLTARHQVVLSSEVAARIAELPHREGETFDAGRPLVAFDCSAHRARLARAQALRDRARAQAAAAQRLDRSGANSRLELATAVAEMAAAEAELAAARVPVERCTIPAPFTGRVVELRVARHQYVTEGTPLLEVLDHRDLEVEVVAPSLWLAWLRPGHRFTLVLDETAQAYPVRVERFGARIDPVSQTVKLYGRLEGSFRELLPGMSGAARIAASGG